MDLQSTVTAFPRATPIDGLDRAWSWRLNPVLNFAGALTGDGTRLLQMNQVRRHDKALALAVLAFAHAHEPELIAEGRFLTCVGGFEALPLTTIAETPQLWNAPGGFVEYENHAGDVRRVEWEQNDTWVLSDASGSRKLGLDELLPLAAESLR
ncbi:hypothetical protein [Streptomyces sasae]|uniref:hypothetical protein n=1 Tax=Streptomyces sasae TaxID=1266772 RepID=UPI00292D99BE|nr:hypothetical protein [Streptomyces sasae]